MFELPSVDMFTATSSVYVTAKVFVTPPGPVIVSGAVRKACGGIWTSQTNVPRIAAGRGVAAGVGNFVWLESDGVRAIVERIPDAAGSGDLVGRRSWRAVLRHVDAQQTRRLAVAVGPGDYDVRVAERRYVHGDIIGVCDRESLRYAAGARDRLGGQ